MFKYQVQKRKAHAEPGKRRRWRVHTTTGTESAAKAIIDSYRDWSYYEWRVIKVEAAERYQQIKSAPERNGETNDCTVIACALTANVSYADAHAAMELFGRKPRQGMSNDQMLGAMRSLFGVYTHRVSFAPATVKTITKQLDPDKHYLVFVRGHVAAVINGKVEDWSAHRQNHVISVYEIGYHW